MAALAAYRAAAARHRAGGRGTAMVARVRTGSVVGLEGALVEVEVDLAQGLPAFTVVGLPDTAVQEARERVRAAIRHAGFTFPARRITVNLAPAEVRKEGAAFDVPIALGVLAAAGALDLPQSPVLFIGELSLDGALRHTTGVLPLVALARASGIGTVVVPACDAPEAALIEGVAVIGAPTLLSLVQHLTGEAPLSPFTRSITSLLDDQSPVVGPDLQEVRGQEHAKRALEVAAAGGHNLLFSGSPGAGKTLLARCLPGILPPLSPDEALEVTQIYSVAGLLPADEPLVRRRPFRSPHHTVSHAGLVGGGPSPRPGELTLSHRGVLFLDELPEFASHTLETLRQPLEDGVVTISRASGTVTFPARVTLVGAMNPCPCGFAGDPERACTCPDGAIRRYQRRLSGPLLDRIDIHLTVPRVSYHDLAVPTAGADVPPPPPAGEPSISVRTRVIAARARQQLRLAGTGMTCNAELTPAAVRDHCQPDGAAEGLLRTAVQRLHLSARGYHRVLKLSRTIADLAGADAIGAPHVAEALQYRPRIDE
jgi:magnesium chelatase family protein